MPTPHAPTAAPHLAAAVDAARHVLDALLAEQAALPARLEALGADARRAIETREHVCTHPSREVAEALMAATGATLREWECAQSRALSLDEDVYSARRVLRLAERAARGGSDPDPTPTTEAGR